MLKKRKTVIKAGVATLAAFTLLFSSPVIPNTSNDIYANTLTSKSFRLAGTNRYDTTLEVSQAGWTEAEAVVLARGDDYPDALAGAVLANSSGVKGPLLLTPTDKLADGVLDEIKRLGAKKVYILGGTGAVSKGVEQVLTDEGLEVERLAGSNRYETAAAIATKSTDNAKEAYIASGHSFADALSISSYAAANESPLLLTGTKELPEVTLEALKDLGVESVTLIGGEGVIDPNIEETLEEADISVDRLFGKDRYMTNLDIISNLTFDTKSIYVATGTNFPDALAGAVLAAKSNSPIVLVPKADINAEVMEYFDYQRDMGASFTMLGGWGVISHGIENIIRTGSLNPRISIQYLQAYGQSAYDHYLEQIAMIPDTATDYVDFVAPHWYSLDLIPAGKTVADGTFTGPWQDLSNYKKIVNAAHGRGLKVLPSLTAPWNAEGKAAVDSVVNNATAREKLIDNISKMLEDIGADGVIIDFEYLSDESGPGLTQFMKELYTRLHGEQKLVVQAVPARKSATDWYQEFEYHNLSKHVDYFNIMTYDYSTSTPGPVAPLGWVKDVLDFAISQNVDMDKVIMGIPYYGRDWKETEPGKYERASLGLNGANTRLAEFNATLERETSKDDPVGIPTFTYTDGDGYKHIVYFDDVKSWGAKLELVNEYDLAGMGAWSLYWVIEETADDIFPLLKQYLR